MRGEKVTFRPLRYAQVPGALHRSLASCVPYLLFRGRARKCGPKIGKRVIGAGSSKIRISLNPQNQQRFTAVEMAATI